MGQLLPAQALHISHIQLDFWLAGKRASSPSRIEAREILTFQASMSLSKVGLLARGLEIVSIRKKEGRLKDDLPFTQKGDSLWISVPVQTAKKYQWQIDYLIPIKEERYHNYVEESPQIFALNQFNMQGGVAGGQAGMFYPALAGDASFLEINLTVKAGKNSGVPGTLSFITDNQDGTISQYWNTHVAFTPESFYLVVGQFKEFDPEEIQEDFALSDMALKKIKEKQNRDRMTPTLEFFGISPEAITDSEYTLLDSLSKRKMSPFFLKPSEVPQLTAEEYAYQQALALYLANYDSAKASQRQWEVTIQHKGNAWKENVLNQKWKGYDDLTKANKKRLLSYRLQQWRDANPEIIKAISSQELDTALFLPLLESLELPELSLSYRYVAGDSAQYINYSQDTSRSQVYALPVKITIYAKEEQLQLTEVLNKQSGRVKIHFLKVPNSVEVEFGRFFPGMIHDNKPDNYNLFQLSKAANATERMKALRGLFTTKNPNLFSTALGIAMDDPEAEIRLEALQNAGNLDSAARQKLKDTLYKLAEDDPDPGVQKEAKLLIQKYYEAK